MDKPSRPGSAPAQPRTDRLIVVALDPGPRRRGPRSHWPRRHPRKRRGAQDRQNAARAHQRQQRGRKSYAGFFDTRRRLFCATACCVCKKPKRVQADLLVSIHADAFYTPRPQGASCVCPQPRWRHQRRRPLDGTKRKQGRCDRRREFGRARQPSATRPARHEHPPRKSKTACPWATACCARSAAWASCTNPGLSKPALLCSKPPTSPVCWWRPPSSATRKKKKNCKAYQKQLTDALLRGILQYFSRNPPLARNRGI